MKNRRRIAIIAAKKSMFGIIIMLISVSSMYYINERNGKILALISLPLAILALVSRWNIEKNKLQD